MHGINIIRYNIVYHLYTYQHITEELTNCINLKFQFYIQYIYTDNILDNCLIMQPT